jgi:tRNA pseudouridine32 synthase/23S rRNA pseudouridine746 synthase
VPVQCNGFVGSCPRQANWRDNGPLHPVQALSRAPSRRAHDRYLNRPSSNACTNAANAATVGARELPHGAPEILYADATLLVVNKPAGLLSVPGRGEDKQDCLSGRLQGEFPDALIVHRLDMHTSGLLVLARGREMQRRLSSQFAERQVDKRYVALVAGRLPTASGEIDLPLSADWPRRPRQKVDPLAGKPSLTRYQVLGHDPTTSRSRLLLVPLTGARTSCACTCKPSATRSSATPFTATPNPRRRAHASCCTPRRWPSPTPRAASRCAFYARHRSRSKPGAVRCARIPADDLPS